MHPGQRQKILKKRKKEKIKIKIYFNFKHRKKNLKRN